MTGEETPGGGGASASDRDRHLDSVLIGGREPVTVVVVDYDPAWPVRFQQVGTRIHAALGATALLVEHIGSTSVPGLAAKPIIDVLLVVPDVEEEPSYVAALEAAGLALRVREPGHRMFRTQSKDVHVHVYGPADQAVTDYLDLRDRLRVDEADRTVYADVKRRLAQRSWSDMNHYADAKSEVIAEILGRARPCGAASVSRDRGPADPARTRPGPGRSAPPAHGRTVPRAR